MRNSLQYHLSRVLIIAILAAGSLASIASFYFAYSEAQEFQDDALRQIAAEGISQQPDARQLAMANQSVSDPESRVRLIHVPGDAIPTWLPPHIPNGFYTFDTQEGRVRVFIRSALHGQLAVVQLTDARDEIAMDSALRTLVPLLLLIPVLIWLVIRIVRDKLSGLRALSADLERQTGSALQPLSGHNLPDEVRPFVHAINGLLVRVGEVLASQRRFIADAAHELRSPLTALSLQVQNLRKASSLDEAQARTEPLWLGIERAKHLTEQLLSLARAQAGDIRQEEVNLSVLVRDLIAEYLPVAHVKAIDLGLDEQGPVVLSGSAGAFRLILKNALDNAIRYTPSGGEVTVRLRQEELSVIVDVIDSGPGIPVEERERVFSPFYRGADSQGDGTGLGLAIARDAAQRLGGEVCLATPPSGKGLIFRYRQPIHTPAEGG
jgi:two-component system OmpR family sensor kinase